MSGIGYRDWEVWINRDYFGAREIHQGHFELKMSNVLMVKQTIEFLYEKAEAVRREQFNASSFSIDSFLHPLAFAAATDEGLILRKYEPLESDETLLIEKIAQVLHELEALSVCVDIPLSCSELRYIIPSGIHNSGVVFFAGRKPFGRGLAFELEERDLASRKLQQDYDYLLSQNVPDKLVVAGKHYLAGLTLLGLEDTVPGLIDAAFMQFYVACEILTGGSSERKKAKRYVAAQPNGPHREIQVIIHHVWQVRDEYFGHGNIGKSLPLSKSTSAAFQIAKQVLVARWLCRRLRDLHFPSGLFLAREMRLNSGASSEAFSGTVQELESQFKIDYDFRRVEIFDRGGKRLEDYVLQS